MKRWVRAKDGIRTDLDHPASMYRAGNLYWPDAHAFQQLPAFVFGPHQGVRPATTRNCAPCGLGTGRATSRQGGILGLWVNVRLDRAAEYFSTRTVGRSLRQAFSAGAAQIQLVTSAGAERQKELAGCRDGGRAGVALRGSSSRAHREALRDRIFQNGSFRIRGTRRSSRLAALCSRMRKQCAEPTDRKRRLHFCGAARLNTCEGHRKIFFYFFFFRAGWPRCFEDRCWRGTECGRRRLKRSCHPPCDCKRADSAVSQKLTPRLIVRSA